MAMSETNETIVANAKVLGWETTTTTLHNKATGETVRVDAADEWKYTDVLRGEPRDITQAEARVVLATMGDRDTPADLESSNVVFGEGADES